MEAALYGYRKSSHKTLLQILISTEETHESTSSILALKGIFYRYGSRDPISPYGLLPKLSDFCVAKVQSIPKFMKPKLKVLLLA